MSKLSKWMLPGLLALFLIFGCKPIKNNYLWQNEIIYFLLIDRFHNGDPTNDRGNNPASHVTYDGTNPEALKTYQGGDLQGVIQRLDYLVSVSKVIKTSRKSGPAKVGCAQAWVKSSGKMILPLKCLSVPLVFIKRPFSEQK